MKSLRQKPSAAASQTQLQATEMVSTAEVSTPISQSNIRVPELEIAEKLYLKGNYTESLIALDVFDNDPMYGHLICERATSTLLRARNLLHMHQDGKAAQLTKSIPQIALDYDRTLCADYYSIMGIMKKRESRLLWKSGDSPSALAKSDEAVAFFNLAEVAAQKAGELGRRLFFNARLNKIYTKGLILAVNCVPPHDYYALLQEAIIAEYNSRRNMTDENRNLLPGATIIADLAMGGRISIKDIQQLSNGIEFDRAYRCIFGREVMSWSEFLLGNIRNAPVVPDGITRVINFVDSPGASYEHVANLLILGCRLLMEDKKCSGASDRLIAYASEMHYCIETLRRNGTSLDKIKKMLDLINRFPAYVYKDRRWPMHYRFFD